MPRFSSFIAPLSLLLVVAACDSSVERDDGAGGAGGGAASTGSPAGSTTSASASGGTTSTGSSGGTTGGGTTGSGTGSSSSGTPGLTPCELFCTEVPQCSSSEACVESCLDTRPEECGAEFDAVVTCRAEQLGPGCDDDGICVAESAAFQTCLETASPTECFAFEGEGSEESCMARGTCLNGAEAVIACEAAGNGATCECYVDDVLLGTCNDPDVSCILEASCCEQFY